ncbi:hypothetical protein AB4Y63_19175, partial [Leifsonia sp. YAF41]|uniref:hypothetical protein n=1 Tax=Leifsonia sp. YAF41 TaxID=3233086 RepID=UPI003F9639E8
MESEPVSLIITPTTDTPVAAVMAQVQAILVDVMAELQTHLLSDDDVLGSLGAMEGIGRLVDAGRVALAADVDARSDTRTQNESLARKRGCATGTDLITMVTRVSARGPPG